MTSKVLRFTLETHCQVFITSYLKPVAGSRNVADMYPWPLGSMRCMQISGTIENVENKFQVHYNVIVSFILTIRARLHS